jgi:23S rRNA (guanosine2251-2'-O)-methyltransferase
MFREISHQGVAALAAACEYVEPEDLIAIAKERNEPLLVVIADGIEDPHNLGAVIRSAEAAGAHGIIIPKRQGAGVTTAVMRSSAGAAGHLAVARVANIAATVTFLKEQGVWIYAADMDGKDWCTVDYTGPVALVLGSEGEGVSRLVKERSDFVVGIPMRKPGSSLNVSVASGIILFEIARQRLHLPSIEQGRG